MGRAYGTNERWEKGTQVFSRKPKGKHPRSRLKMGWEDNIISDFKEIDYEGDWKTCLCLGGNEPSGSIISVS